MDFNRTELEKLLNGISKIIITLEREYLFNKSTKIYLGNGESIDFTINRQNLAHLLGVDTNYLKSLSIFRETGSYELLKKMCDESYKIHDLHSKGIISYDKLFSKNIIEKLSGFWKNININCNETEFICKYDASRSYKSNESNEKFDYIIVKNIDGKYYMLCLVKNAVTGDYVPMSNRYFENLDEAQDQLSLFLVNQEITFMNSSRLDGYRQNILNDKLKLEKVQNLDHYRRMYRCSIDLTGDYTFIFKRVISHKNNASENYVSTNDNIIASIKDGKLIDSSSIQDRNLVQISEAFNDFICSKNIEGKSEEIGNSYSKLIKELEEAKKILLENKELIESLTEKNKELEEENEYLKNEKVEFISAFEDISNLLNKTKQKIKD